MNRYLTVFLPAFLITNSLIAQAVFTSNGSGIWNDPVNWQFQSGTTTVNYPVAGDTATISNAHTITVSTNSQCGQLTITNASILHFNSTSSILTIAGSVTIAAASSINIDQGIFTVAGLMIVNAPTSSTGITLLNVQGGAFSCVGGMTITGVTSTRQAELRIGNSAVNIVGGLATITANARINFSGSGTLTLAGIISISNTNSFIAGTGRVIYIGIPGTDQGIASLTYNRLVIAGLGSGSKKINGAVVVTDTLSLLNDTLTVTNGSLTMNNNSTIVRTAGKLLSVPVFAGAVDLVYNNILRDTTGPELPVSTTALRNLSINNISGVDLGANATINNKLSLQFGALQTHAFSLTIANTGGGITDDPGIERTNGYVLGTIVRNIGNSTGIRIFPLGINSTQGYRELKLTYTTAPSVAGSLTVTHFDEQATSQTGLPLMDGAITIVRTAPMYWQADASGGLSGGNYTLQLIAEGANGISNINTLRILKRPSAGGAWTVDGIAGINSGTTSAPVIIRENMNGFSQFTYGSDNSNTLPVRLLYFTGELSGKNAILSWATSFENNSRDFAVQRSPDGASFETIGLIPSAGNSSGIIQYHFTDINVAAGGNFYRLKQTDIDGRYTYSPVIIIKVNKKNSITVLPSVAYQTITVAANNNDIRLFNSAGQYLQKLTIGNNDISHLQKGIYIAAGQDCSAKFIKN